MKSFFFFSFIVLLVVTLLLAGCNSKDRCDTDTDCSASGEYQVPVCADHKCYTKESYDVCGNNVCEDGETPCNCIEDCNAPTPSGYCAGKITYPNPAHPQRMMNATYASYYCNEEDACVIGSKPEDTTAKTLFAEESRYLDYDFTFTLSQPFTIGTGDFIFKAKLTDYDETWVVPPFKITGIKVLYGDELVGEQELNMTFENVGETHEQAISIAPHLDALEKTIALRMQVDYEYYLIIGDGLRIERDSASSNFNDLFFIDPERAP